MKKTINPGAYGWRHQHWLKSFYPDNLPVKGAEDWRLSYYSNEFNTVLVPFDYWQSREAVDCENWLDDVGDNFQFFVECRESMLANISLSELTDSLKKLKPQLSALVFLEDKQHSLVSEGKAFQALIDALEVDVFESGAALYSAMHNVWRQDKHQSSRFVFVESALTDLKSARTMVEGFINSSASFEPRVLQKASQKVAVLLEETSDNMTIIVNHPQLQASDLRKFRTVLEIMGY